MKTKVRVSPVTGKPYPKCDKRGCTLNVYSAGRCIWHQKPMRPKTAKEISELPAPFRIETI